ncbi:unnamed protein product [Dimorphilus gyrociliatus]|uniref:Uncharacterized protein n=1 Tax=Dimorphilus gyrociliatus TaxID=2664684 RepID=A0A7I8VGA7_9ANNE|nr:unnamed protein product [Dimorphilus gyrociliatus]
MIMLFMLFHFVTFPISEESSRKPIILVPGIGGCQLEAKLTDDFEGDKDCHHEREWFRVWADVAQFSSMSKESICLQKYLKLIYNETTKISESPKGIKTRIPGWGETTTLEYVDPSWTAWIWGNLGTYLSPLVSSLLALGYKRGRDLRGAPYDWRKGPHSQIDFFIKLKILIEETTNLNKQKVVLFSHSLGGIFTLYFLQIMPRVWKDKHIDNFVAVNSPWGGTILSLLCYASGYNWGIPYVDPLSLRVLQRSYESSSYVFPNMNSYSKNESLVLTPSKIYTIENIEEFFDDIEFNRGNEFSYNVMPIIKMLMHPEVTVNCIYSSGIKSPAKLSYEQGFPDEQPKFIYEDGDGTLITRSMKACEIWNGEKSHPDYNFYLHHVPGVNHHDILSNKNFLKILNIVIE